MTLAATSWSAWRIGGCDGPAGAGRVRQAVVDPAVAVVAAGNDGSDRALRESQHRVQRCPGHAVATAGHRRGPAAPVRNRIGWRADPRRGPGSDRYGR